MSLNTCIIKKQINIHFMAFARNSKRTAGIVPYWCHEKFTALLFTEYINYTFVEY